MARLGLLVTLLLLLCLHGVLCGWQNSAEDALKFADLEEASVKARFTKACTERCLQRLRSGEKCNKFCDFVPTLIEENFEDLQRLPLTAEEMDWVIYDLTSWGLILAQDGTDLTPYMLSTKFLMSCREMVDVYYEL